MTTAEKLAHLNQLREQNGKSPLKAWKSSGEKLDQAIQAEEPQFTLADLVWGVARAQRSAQEGRPSDDEGQTDEPSEQSEEGHEEDEQSDEQADEGTTPEQPKSERGAIGRLVISLLVDTDDDYATIVAKVKEAHPDAKTTARSIASVAADLRRDGVDVKSRRKVKAPKAD